MTYQVSWLVPNRIIDVIMPEKCNDEALRLFDSDVIRLLDSVSQTTHLVIDVRPMKQYPSAQATLQMKHHKHKNIGHVMIIGLNSNPILRFLASLVTRGTNVKLQTFSNREELEAYLSTIEKI